MRFKMCGLIAKMLWGQMCRLLRCVTVGFNMLNGIPPNVLLHDMHVRVRLLFELMICDLF